MIEIKLDNNNQQCKVLNDIWYHIDTPNEVIRILNTAYENRETTRVRLFFGDKDTGKDYGQIYNTLGYVKRTIGNYKIAILTSRKDSPTGDSIEADLIVKITIDKQVVYQHPKYNIDVSGKEPIMADYLLGKRNNYTIKKDLEVTK